MKRLLSLLIVLALAATFIAVSTGVASADAPEKVEMLYVLPPGELVARPIALPVIAQDGAQTAAQHSPVLLYASP